MTLSTQRVLSAMLQAPSSHHYGLELMRATGLKSGTLYPILSRLEANGWVTSEWESLDPAMEGRPRRRLYELTPNGVAWAKAALAETATSLGFKLTGDLA